MPRKSIPWPKHLLALRKADEKFDRERDRRYAEVNTEREKALKIKEEADKVALDLARQIQTYKDEKANELREQINSERGRYATKEDLAAVTDKIQATMKPLSEYVTSQQGSPRALTWPLLFAVLLAVSAAVAMIGTGVAIYFAVRG